MPTPLPSEKVCRHLRVAEVPKHWFKCCAGGQLYSQRRLYRLQEKKAGAGDRPDKEDVEKGMHRRARRPRESGLESTIPGIRPTRCAGPARPSPPAPPYIFMVPLGPKLVLSTSCSPRAALMLTANAAWARATSALGFRVFTAAIADSEDYQSRREDASEPPQRGPEALSGSSGKVGLALPAPSVPARCPHWAACRQAPLIGSRWRSGPAPSRPVCGAIARGRSLFSGRRESALLTPRAGLGAALRPRNVKT